jgi:periplasmic divalent cation tolerance protein
MADYVQVLTTTDSEEHALRLGSIITDARLAACVQIVGPIRSLYWWEGKVQNEQEWQLLIKTTGEIVPTLKKIIKENHGYEVPEIIVTPIIDGNEDYLDWINEQTRQTDAS